MPTVATKSPLRRLRSGLALATLPFAFAACATPEYDPVLQPGPDTVDASLRGLWVVDDDIAWASGSAGTIVRTLDGGDSWQVVPPPPQASERDFRDIHAESAQEAFVMAIASPAQIWHTEDGGTSWTLVLEDPREGSFLDSFDINDDGFGVAWGDPVDGEFACFQTEDGGRTWKPLTTLPRPALGEAGFAASGTCVECDGDRIWIGSGGGAIAQVYRGPDRGEKSFLTMDTPVLAGKSTAGIFSIATLAESGRVVVVGGDYEDPTSTVDTAAWTANSGLNWVASMRPPAGFRSCVAVGRGDLLVSCGPTGVDRSTDGGNVWQTVGKIGYHTVAFAPGGRVAYLVGPGGRTARITLEPRP